MIYQRKRIEVFFLSSEFLEFEVDAVLSIIEANGYIIENKHYMKVPQDSFFAKRRQYNAGMILNYLSRFRTMMALGVMKDDIYFQNLNFVFGLASPTAKVAVVSLARLNPEFYGDRQNVELYVSRIRKEVIHEIGHLEGLSHCQTQGCVMNFSNSIFDVDRKSDKFCNLCLKHISRLYY